MSKELVKQQKDKLRELLTKYRRDMANALPKHIPVDRLTRLVLTEFSRNPALWDADINSLLGAVLQAAQMGLEIGILGQGFLVPFYDRKSGKKLVQFIPGWQGLLSLVYRDGRAQIATGAVYEGDEFEFSLGTDPHIRHIPKGDCDPTKLKYVYAIAWVKGFDRPLIEVWTAERVWKHRDKINKVGSAHYSFQYPEQYARKVVLLALLDYVPRSVEVSQAIRAEYQAAEGQAVSLGDIIEVTPEAGEPSEGEATLPSEAVKEDNSEAVANAEDKKVSEAKKKLKERLAKKENGLLGGDEG
jgi:recombination protein RecT